MVERRRAIQKSVKYEGVFDSKELFRLITDWELSKGFDLDEKKVEEYFRNGKKTVNWVSEAPNKITDYVNTLMSVFVGYTDLKDKTIEVNGKRRNLKEGKVSINITGWIETDYEKKWEGSAWKWFIRMLAEKFLLRERIEEGESEIKRQVNELYDLISKFFNIHKY